ncbi:MAG: hypothetical protein RR882_00365 [Comamonas sp.]
MNMSSQAAATIKPPLWRWLLAIGVDALLLVLIWWEYLQPRQASFALGSWLLLLFTCAVWLSLLRRFLLAWRVRRVFGSAIDHLRPAPLSLVYRGVSGLGDLLLTGSLVATGQSWLAGAYGLAALLQHGAQWRRARTLMQR